MPKRSAKELAIVAISGLSWPTRSRQYLINLVKEVVVESKAKFVIIAGHTVDGKYLEAEFKARLKERIAAERKSVREQRADGDTDAHVDIEWIKQEFEREFVSEYAEHLSEFLPDLPGNVNWHIVIAERIYDRPIGAKILEALRGLRNDVRIVGERQEDGFYDREPKFPVQFPGFETIRVIVPHRSPWFSRMISNLVQRLHHAFAPRTLSPKPDLTLTGVTGTAVHLPYYDGVPNISIPALNKLVEQQATEHMIGATVVRIIANDKEGVRIVNGVHNFRTAAFMEKQVAVSSSLPKAQQAVLHALVPSDASLKALRYRVNAERKRFQRKDEFSEEVIRKALDALVASGKIVFYERSNRYGVNEELRRNADITLASLHAGARTIKHVVWSCYHGGAAKTLYFTSMEDLPRMLADADAGIENGDITQGNAHNYDYNGEVLPGLNTVDKQEILNAHIRATILIDAFKLRLARDPALIKKDPKEAVERAFVPYRFAIGNHDVWRFYAKVGLILQQFEDALRSELTKRVAAVCQAQGISYCEAEARALVDRKVKRIGESRMTDIDGVLVGVKHPFKSRTVTKSTRIQEVVDFMWRRFESFTTTVAKNSKGFALAYVANFHEAAAAHVTKFGQTVLGVMTGCYLHDTEFESNVDKVVDRGPATVVAVLDPDGRLLYSETEFIPRIAPEDREFVTADRLDSKQVYERCIKLLDRISLKLPWR